MNIKLASAAAVAALIAAAPASATITVYNNMGGFNNNTTARGTDTFDDFANDDVTDSPIFRSAGAYSYRAAVPGNFFGAGSGSDHWLSTNFSDRTITFNQFGGAVSAVGGFFFDTDVFGAESDLAGSIILTVTDADGDFTRTIANPGLNNFIGFVSSNTITRFTVQGISGAYPTVNNLTLGRNITAAVPEPATWAMMLVGFAMVGGAARYRRRKSSVSFA